MSRQVSKQKHFRCPKGKLTSVCWHFEGKQFVCSLSDGSLVTYNLRGGQGKWAKQVEWIFNRTNKDQQHQPADNCNQTRYGLTRARTPRGSHCPRLTRCVLICSKLCKMCKVLVPNLSKVYPSDGGAEKRCSQTMLSGGMGCRAGWGAYLHIQWRTSSGKTSVLPLS